jgi:hypothetical protein
MNNQKELVSRDWLSFSIVYPRLFSLSKTRFGKYQRVGIDLSTKFIVEKSNIDGLDNFMSLTVSLLGLGIVIKIFDTSS